MKKKGTLFLMSCILVLHVAAQKKDKSNAPAPVVTQEKVRVPEDDETIIYRRAIKYGDYDAAKNAMFSLIQKHPENKSYLDSLVRLYFSLGAYPQCILA